MEQKKLEEAKDIIGNIRCGTNAIGRERFNAFEVAIECIERVSALEKENEELRKIVLRFMGNEDVFEDMCKAICNKDCPHRKNGVCSVDNGEECYATNEETLEHYIKQRAEIGVVK